MSAFDKNDPEFQALLVECMKSTRVFAKTFFPEDVESDFSILHNKVFNVLDGPKKRKAAAAPRGLGKTTLAKIRACKAVVFRETNFIIYLSNSATSAEEQTEHIKAMLQSPRILEVFGDIKTRSDTGQKESFSKKAWVAFGDIFVLPRGAGQQVRGQNWRGHRPGLIIIDDLEDTELVRSEEQRQKLKTWFFADLMKTESRYSEPAEFIYIDTIKHQDSLLQLLIDSDDWDSVVLSICDENFNSYDPNYMTTEELKKEYETHREDGETDLFYMERMNIAISLKDAIFKPEYNKYFDENNGQLKAYDGDQVTLCRVSEMVTFVICDPAKTVKMHSAESAVMTVSVHRPTGKIFYRTIFSGKVRPDELYDIMFDQVLMFNAMMLCVEVTGLNEFISQPIENQMRKRCLYPQFIQLHAKGDKLMRISTLEPNYRLGYMYHNRQTCTALENQLQWFPKSKLLDVVDAASYINHIMDEHAIYFDPSDDEHDPKDEFDELEDELPQDDWRPV
jgi:hypothetical protein